MTLQLRDDIDCSGRCEPNATGTAYGPSWSKRAAIWFSLHVVLVLVLVLVGLLGSLALR